MLMLPSDLGLPSDLFPSFRVGQEKAILALSSQMGTHPISLLKAPTGTGKSLLTVAAALYTGKRALYLVQQHAHQDQVMQSFSCVGMVEVRGHKNYPCAAIPRYTPSADSGGGELDTECLLGREKCSWWAAIEQASRSPLVCMNYSLWLSLAKAGLCGELGTFDLLIADEAHAVPDLVCDHAGVDIYLPFLETALETYPLSLAEFDSLPKVESLCREARSTISHLLSRAKESGTAQSSYNKRLQRLLSGIQRFLSRPDGSGNEWIIHDSGNSKVLSLRPVWAKSYTRTLLTQGVENTILTSATLYDFLITFLGIDRSLTQTHEMQSPFSPLRHPFYYCPTAKITYNTPPSYLDILTRRIEETCLQHFHVDDSRKGIIHTHSYRLLEQIIPRLKHHHLFIYPRRGEKSGPVFERFLHSSGPLTYIGPAKEEGIDLKDDLCRFSGLAKVPLPKRKDPLTHARIHSPEGGEIYADYVTALSVEQSVGRDQRSEKDWSYCYMWDSNWTWFHKRWLWSQHFVRTWKDTWYTTDMELPRVPDF
jgi:Rad3-related DNA helicase